jgi:hypothetical protein
LNLASDALKRAQSNEAKNIPSAAVANHKASITIRRTVGDFYVKEISRNTITLEAADGFQPNPFPGQ